MLTGGLGLLASWAVALMCLLYTATAHAQTVVLPGAADPTQIERQRFKPPPQPLSEPGALVEPGADLRVPPANAGTIKFILSGVIIESATVYSNNDFLPFYEALLGKETTLTQIYNVAANLTAKYRGDGYILSQVVVPAQHIQGGVVTLRAIEGFVDRIIIEGELHDSQNLVARLAEKITADRPLHSTTLERYILLIDDLPGIRARAILKPSATPQAADLIVQIQSKLFDGYTGFDNRGTRYLGPYQASAEVNANSLFGLGERISLQGITATQPGELKYLQLANDLPLGDDGTRLRVSVATSQARPGFTLTENKIDSESLSSAIEVFHPFIRSRSENLSSTVRFGTRNVTTDQNAGAARLTKDIIRVFRWRGDYDFVDTSLGTSINLISLEASQGLNILGARESGSDKLSRTNGRSDFTKANLVLQRLQVLGDGFSLLAAINSQYALSTLLSSEEFAFGGNQFGRGYDPAEITGEHGIAGKVELRYGQNVDSTLLQSYQLYGFYDAGVVWNRDSDATTPPSQSAASAGFGTRLNATDWLSANFEIGIPLTRPVDAMGKDGNDPRGFFSLVARF